MMHIINFILENKYTLLVPIIFATILLILDTYANSNKLSRLGLVIFFITIGGFIFMIVKSTKVFKIDFSLFVIFFSIIAFFYNSIVYARASFKYNKLANLLIALPSNIESQIYIYLDEKSKPALFTEQFYSLFEHLHIGKNNLKRELSYVSIESYKYNYKQFQKILMKTEERSYKMQFVFAGDFIVPVQLTKRKVINKGRLLGYVFINQNLTVTEVYKENVNNKFKRRQHIFFDLLGKPMAYLDPETKRIILNSRMRKLLKAEESEIAYLAFEQYVFEEDKNLYKSRKIVSDCGEKNYYRLKTINGVEWFEEATLKFEEYEYLVLHRTDFSLIKTEMFNYVNLIDDLKNITAGPFLLILLAINELPSITESIGKDGAEIVISQYFRNIKSYAGETKRIYKVGQIEYALIIFNTEKYDIIVRDLEKGFTEYLGTDVYLNEMKFSLHNSIGLVNSDSVVEKNAESVVKAGFDALSLATDVNYKKQYSIYQQQKRVDDATNYDIDLSDDFLDKILKG